MECSPEVELSEFGVNSGRRCFLHLHLHGVSGMGAQHTDATRRWGAERAERRRSMRTNRMGWMNVPGHPVHAHPLRPPNLDPGPGPEVPPTRAPDP